MNRGEFGGLQRKSRNQVIFLLQPPDSATKSPPTEGDTPSDMVRA